MNNHSQHKILASMLLALAMPLGTSANSESDVNIGDSNSGDDSDREQISETGPYQPVPTGNTRGRHITAALTRDEGHSYHFFSDGTYARINSGQYRYAPGYPKSLPGGWRNLTGDFANGRMTAATRYDRDQKRYYMFAKPQHSSVLTYARLSNVTVLRGYPKNMPGGWKNIPIDWRQNLDAAFFDSTRIRSSSGTEYNDIFLFKGDEVLKLNGVTAVSGYPKKIAQEFPLLPAGWTSNFDAAYERWDKAIVLIKGGQYLLLDNSRGNNRAYVLRGYPKALDF